MVARGLPSQFRRALLAWFVLAFVQVASATAGTVRLYWDANTEPDLAGYVLVWGAARGVYSQSLTVPATVVTQEVTGVPDGTWYFAIRAFNASGLQSSLSNEVTVTVGQSAPTVTSFSPALGPVAGGTPVTITGTNFQSGVTVRFGTRPATVTSVTSTRIVATAPAALVAGRVDLFVVNPDGTGVQLPQAYTYQTGLPVITSLAPVTGPAAGGTRVTITGTGFQPGASVSFDGQPATVLSVSPTSVVVSTPARAPGLAGLMLTNPDSQSASRSNAYTYGNTGPFITHVLPDSGPASGGTTVSVVGGGFAVNAAVTFDGVAARVVSRADGVLTVQSPAHATGAVAVAVINGDSTAIRPSGFSYASADETFVRYFAEGASGSFFQTRFAVANPHTEAVTVTVTFTDTLGTPTSVDVTVPALSRVTLDERNRPVLASEAFATKFECARVVGVERTVTWAAGGPTYGAHSETGVAAPRTSWTLAEGATMAGFNTFYLLQNPTTETAQVKVQYLLATGERLEKVHPVAPLSRTNIWVNKDDPKLEAAEMSATLTSVNGVPVVVERSMYRNNGGELFSAGHNSAAVEAPALRWFLAEGATGGTFDEFVLIANPNATAATLKVSYLRAGQAPLVQTHVAPALSRLTLWVDEAAPDLANAEVSIVVESVTPTPVVVERSMWWRATPGGEWVEAHNSRGATSTAPRWVVSDGEAGGPAQASTYVLVANTSGAPASVRFTLLPETGTPRSVVDTVSANGRFSLDVAAAFPEAGHSRFSVLVESVTGTAPLVVERASYSSTPTTPWASGTNALAMPVP